MKCNCKQELETKLLGNFKANHPEALGHELSLQGYGFVIVGNQMDSRGCMEIQSTAEYPLKKGGTKERTIKQSMFFSFCPFCGVPA